MNASTLERMNPSALLEDTALGGPFNAGALADALLRGRLVGAALDVRVSEPPGKDD